MNNLITPINFKIDIDVLKLETTEILKKFSFNKENQICFQNTSTMYNVYEGTGDSRLSHCPMYGLKEEDFKFFNPEFSDTIFKKIFDTFPFNIGRMRLMNVPSKKCYWMHTDPGIVRYQFAIETNPDCFILYREHGAYHIPPDGMCYKMNTDEYHTAINASREDRIHLVISGL
jgi:hypothetical protein